MGLTLFAETGCSGTSKELKDSEVNISKVGVKFAVKSARVDGNPWILFTEERFQGFLAYLEEGTFDDLETLGLPKEYKIASVKYKKDSLANPQIRLFNSSTFKGATANNWWVDGDGNEAKKMKWLNVGSAGVWAITLDQTVECKTELNHITILLSRCCIEKEQAMGLIAWVLAGPPSWAR